MCHLAFFPVVHRVCTLQRLRRSFRVSWWRADDGTNEVQTPSSDGWEVDCLCTKAAASWQQTTEDLTRRREQKKRTQTRNHHHESEENEQNKLEHQRKAREQVLFFLLTHYSPLDHKIWARRLSFERPKQNKNTPTPTKDTKVLIMTMLECLHNHIIKEIQLSSKTDTVVVVTALAFDLIIMLINTSIAGRAGYVAREIAYEKQMKEREMKLQEMMMKQNTEKKRNVAAKKRNVAQNELPPVERPKSYFAAVSPDLFLWLFMALTAAVNYLCFEALRTNRTTRQTLLQGLTSMYQDEKIDKYYSKSLLQYYSKRYTYFMYIIGGLCVVDLLLPLVLRF